MKNLLFIFILVSTILGYSEERKLSLSVNNVKRIYIDAGAGFLKVRCLNNINKINVHAEIIIESVNEKEARKYIDNYMRLNLLYKDGKAILKSCFDNNFNNIGSFLNCFFKPNMHGYINLMVEMPDYIELQIDDGSGNIHIDDLKNNLIIDDGSGDIFLSNIEGSINVDDGSGNFSCVNCSGQFYLDDGSGDIKIFDSFLNGTIVDGSGDLTCIGVHAKISLDDASGDIKILDSFLNIKIDDGSGDIDINNNTGYVYIDDGTGFLKICNINGNLTIEKSNISNLVYKNIKGKVNIVE